MLNLSFLTDLHYLMAYNAHQVDEWLQNMHIVLTDMFIF